MSHLIEVDQKEVELEQIEATSAVKVPKRTVVVEPLMVMGIMVIICLRYISTLYVYDRVAQDITSQYGWNNTDNLDNGSQCDVNHSSEVYIVREKVQQKTAAFKAYMNMAYIPAFFVVLFLGSYSDKTGRKYAIMAPCLSTLLKTVCYVLVILFKLPIWVLLVGAFIDGMGGTEYMLYVGTYSYLCDITTKENRAKRLVILEVGFMSAAVTCSLAAGFILKHSHYLYLTLGVLVMSIVMVVYGIFFIPETLTKDRDARFFACTTLAASAKIFTKDNGEGRRWRLQCALVAFSARVMCHHSYTGGILNLFTMNVPLCWQAEMVTYNDVVTRGLALILTPLSAKVFAICLSVRSITLAGGLSEVMLFAYVGAVQNTLMMFIGGVFYGVGSLFMPMTRTYMSQMVEPKEHGALFGSLGCIEVFCILTGGVLFNFLYSSTVYLYPGFVFFIMAFITLCGLIPLFVSGIIDHRRSRRHDYEALQEEGNKQKQK